MEVSSQIVANREKCRRYYERNKSAQRERCLRNYYKRRKQEPDKVTAINRKAKAVQRYGAQRVEILARFGNKCANCGSEKHLRIHHIDNRGRKVEGKEKANNRPDNLMVVCQRCHMMHHRYGLKLQMKT